MTAVRRGAFVHINDPTLDRIEAKLDGLVRAVGYAATDEHGALIGEGVAGDLARLKVRVEARFARDDGRARYAAGAVAAAGLSLTAFWWLIRHRLETLFQ